MDIVKLAVALILAGGCRNTEEYSHSVRSESHLLLIGDPGMGKSQILRFASKVISHSVITSGMGSTTAGLTVTAIKVTLDETEFLYIFSILFFRKMVNGN